ncbi:MAG TPA: GAF domain-containing protein [Rhodospirillales bacterium]|nr:GAF domain-containing protein [Rhodospirillales bacterium]
MVKQAAKKIPTGGDVENFSDHLELLALMGRDFAASMDIEETLNKGLARITRHLNAVGGALFLLDETGEKLCCTSCSGDTEITGLTLGGDEGIVGYCVQNNVAEIVRDVTKDPNFQQAVDKQTGFVTKSILCAPMSVHDQCIGAIELVNKVGGDGLFSEADLQLLQALSSSAALAIINARMAEALVEQERVKRELELAAEIQRSLLPDKRSESFPVHGVNLPARMVSGDFYDFFPLDDGRICFNLADVSGKGMNAALLMAKTASLFRCLGKTIHEPGLLLAKINAEICETATRGMFVTMVGGVYDPKTGHVRLANAGHEPPLFHDANGAFTALPAEAPPLGISPLLVEDGGFPETELDLKGGTLYVFTDGLTEGYVEDGSELQVDGLKKLIEENAALSAPKRLDAIIARINRDDQALRDDLTALIIEDSAQPEMLALHPGVEIIPSDGAGGEKQLKLKLKFPSQPNRLKLVRSLVSATAELCGCGQEASQDIVLAIDEACQNVIRHAYKDEPNGEIILEIRHNEDEMIILLRDFAKTVDTAVIRPRELDDVRPGGLGTHFIREVMDEVAFMPPPEDGGNLLKMVKRISHET